MTTDTTRATTRTHAAANDDGAKTAFGRAQMTTDVIRPATPADADDMAHLVDIAGEGLPTYLWRKAATAGQSVWAVGRERALRENGAFSYRNAILVEAKDGHVAGSLIGYTIDPEPEPIPDDFPPMFRPLQELENLAPGSWYVNVLAVYPQYQGQGYGSALLKHADQITHDAGHAHQSIIVSNANDGAFQLYARSGFQEAARRPMVKDGWNNDGTEWVLMIKQHG